MLAQEFIDLFLFIKRSPRQMVKFLDIDCVKRDGTLVVAIYGTIAPQASNQVPTKGLLRAIQTTKGPAWCKMPSGKFELIQFLTMGPKNTKCFFIPDTSAPQKNYLDRFQDCKS